MLKRRDWGVILFLVIVLTFFSFYERSDPDAEQLRLTADAYSEGEVDGR